MVTYCIGSARQKRAYFAEMSGAVILDNVEVLFCASENGRNYFALGNVPFSTFTVAEYLKYRRALCSTQADPKRLEKFGISQSARLGRLSPVQMRCVSYVEKTDGGEDRPIVINLDGAKYSRRRAACLEKLLDGLPEAYVCVSDMRFVKRNTHRDRKTLSFGKPTHGKRPSFYCAHMLAKRILAKKVCVF